MFSGNDDTMPRRSHLPAMPRALSYFPAPFPDELIYSLVARYAHDTQLSVSATNERLFGRGSVHISYDTPTQVNDLSEHTVGADAEQLIQRHTLVPFFTALMSPLKQERTKARIYNNEQVIRNLLGPHARVPRPSYLRFCPECDLANVDRLGVAFWQRKHQLPTSVVCAMHGRPLLRSTSSTAQSRIRIYDCAGEPGIGQPQLVPELGSRRLHRFIALAEEGYRLLEAGENSLGPRSPPSLQRLAFDAGFGIGRKVIKIDQQTLANEFITRDLDVVRLWPWLSNINRAKTLDWIQRHTLRTDGNSATTFTYAVLKTFLSYERHASTGTATEPAPDWSEVAFEPRMIERSRNARRRSEAELSDDAKAAARAIMDREPPVRVWYSEIIRQAPSLHQAMRSGRFPNLRNMIEQCTEDMRSFQLRRVGWLMRQKRASGEEPTMTWVRQRSGIPDLVLIRRLMQDAMNMTRDGSG